MRENQLLRRLRSRETNFAFGLSIASHHVAESMASLGFHLCFIDLQHYPLSYQDAATLSAAVWAGGSTPIVRVPWLGTDHIQRALDAGAGGVMVPVINTAEEAATVVQAAKYPPQGIRSRGGSLHTMAYRTDAPTYYAHANDETVVIVQLETRESIDRAEEILGVDGVDACIIGSNDLAASFGLTQQEAWQREDYRAALRSVVPAAERTGTAPGLATHSVAMAREWEAAGFRLFTVGTDMRLLMDTAEQLSGDLGLL